MPESLLGDGLFFYLLMTEFQWLSFTNDLAAARVSFA
jgi:hypothetical protein